MPKDYWDFTSWPGMPRLCRGSRSYTGFLQGVTRFRRNSLSISSLYSNFNKRIWAIDAPTQQMWPPPPKLLCTNYLSLNPLRLEECFALLQRCQIACFHGMCPRFVFASSCGCWQLLFSSVFSYLRFFWNDMFFCFLLGSPSMLLIWLWVRGQKEF